MSAARRFLLLQGPTNRLFPRVAERLRAQGHEAWRIHLCTGDRLFWRGPGAVAFRGRPGDWPAFVAGFLDGHGIDEVVLLGEQREYHRVAIAAARARGAGVSATDFGYLRPDWVTLERDGLNGASRFPREAEAIREAARGLPAVDRGVRFPHRPLRQAVTDMAFHLSTTLAPWPFPHYRRHTRRNPVANYLGTGWRLAVSALTPGRARRVFAGAAARGPVFLFAMQMEDDFALRAYSRFPDMDSAMRETVASFARAAPAAASLVFKVHPLDPGLKDWEARVRTMAFEAGAGGRVLYVDGGDLDAQIRASAGVLTVNSTVGLRAIELGRPAVALGEAIYRRPGLAFGGPLDDFWRDPPPPDAALADAAIRLIACALQVRGSMYDPAGVEAAAEGIAYRLHHGLVNAPLAQVARGEPLRLP